MPRPRKAREDNCSLTREASAVRGLIEVARTDMSRTPKWRIEVDVLASRLLVLLREDEEARATKRDQPEGPVAVAVGDSR